MSRTTESVYKTMKSARCGLKNVSTLRNLTDLRPVIHNETRWSGKVQLLRRFEKIRSELIEVSTDEIADIPIDASYTSSRNTSINCNMLRNIDDVTKELQRSGTFYLIVVSHWIC